MKHPYFDLPTPIPAAHRGASGEVPENTLPAFERALEQGAAILETDVQATGDGVPVLLHDASVERTTDGSGPVSEMSFDRLGELDAGFRFTTDEGASFPYRGRGLRVPGLEQTFRAFPQARFNLELKDPDPALIRRVLTSIAAWGRADRTLVTAGADASMGLLRQAVDETGLRVAVGASVGDVRRFVLSAMQGAPPPVEPMALQVPAEYQGVQVVTERLVEHAHAHGVQVHVWTINEPDEMERLLDLGVDAVISDFPRVISEVIARRRR